MSILAPGLVIFKDWVDPVTYTENPRKAGKDLILKYAPFIDYEYYNWANNSWIGGYTPLVLTINGETATDMTQYGRLVPPIVKPYALTGSCYYWLDKEKIHTNIDFFDYRDDEMTVETQYQYIVTDVRVKIVLRTNEGNIVEPPKIDWYSLDIGGEDGL